MLRDLLLPCDWEDKGPYTVTVYLGTGRGAAAPQARADTANRGRGLEATPFDARLASIDPQGRTAHHRATRYPCQGHPTQLS
jgi:hypothetical protein